ncbi:VOC family protein [Thalassovita sp.]|jgi:catechol 2,3-dioxygenase-like lactoylglutathione lyase family enzyme|uniref:VOC family protein n=1 Tax=Thalassovita sp. TaxID=1979401 RepID=UPI003B5A4C52
MTPKLKTLDHLVLTVADMDASIRFYQSVLGMQAHAFQAADGGTRWALSFGQQKINLHQQGAEFEPKAHRATPGSADLCFLSDTPLEVWLAHFADHEIEVLEGPVRRSGATGPILSLYLRDPDQNLIEVSNEA